MNYQSIANLSEVVRCNLSKIPRDIDLIVGVPRSGVLPASMVALHLNVHYCDLNTLIQNDVLRKGQTRIGRHPEVARPSDARHILILDDSVATGGSMARLRRTIDALGLKSQISYGAVYATKESQSHVDIYFAMLATPRVFEWNLMHRTLLSQCCVDIDGVLCWDPTEEENDDGPAYRNFLLSARPLALPSHRIGHLVSSRLEKYRPETEAWLRHHGVEYDHLHLLDLPDAATRRKMGNHGAFKARVYSELKDAILFIESEPHQAMEIARTSGKPALCYGNQNIYQPGLSYANLQNRRIKFLKRIRQRIQRVVGKLLYHE